MENPRFVHLRLHSEYSISDGVARIKGACAKAAQDMMPALALTDLGNLFGMVKFYQAARGQGLKPIIGCDVWISGEKADQANRLLLLAQNHEGYLRLCGWLTRAYLENQQRGRAEFRRDWFGEDRTDGLIALSGGPAGDVSDALLADNHAAATSNARRWAQLFPDRYYLEVQRSGQANAEALVRQTVALASQLRLPVVATHPIQFLSRDEFLAHEARVCISEGYVLSDQRRPRPYSEEQYFKTQAEMAELFSDLPQALQNSVEIARRCSLVLELGKAQLPQFPTPGDIPLEQYLSQQAAAGLDERLAQLYPDPEKRAEAFPRYRERLEFEIETIVQMGFPGYFLIVSDFINWAKNNGVPVGPGRGSGAGSLVAYSLGITDLDPLQYNLLFERFLNPERVSMPDFDIDFCQEGRDRVIEYVRQKYGGESVSQIATFGTMAAKAVVRDVGRVMEWNYGRTDELAKLIPFQPGKLITLEMARGMEPRLKEREESDEETRELLALAGQLEGLTRNVGMHAGGVLIAPGKLSDFCPLYCASGSESVISQLDKDDVEQIGLVKFDFLGLTTLTILDWTLRFIRRLDPDSDINLQDLPLDDAAAYKVFVDGNTTAVFQFESRGMRDLVQRARPDRFEDIIALVALFRPGPMDLIPDFVERKHGRQQVSYPDPRVEPILSETYGIMVYQEQVMQMAQIIGGYSLGGADLLRRAMGKKKPEEMAKHRTIFLEGAAKNGLSANKGNEIFDLMEKFAGYGFNKSHAAAYALVAYQTAYFKAHHPAPFMAANMSAVMDDTDKVQQFYADSVANGLKVLPPDIHQSEYRFAPVDGSSIRYGLGAVKGTGELAIEHIIAERANGPFADLFDFCRRVDRRLVNRRVIESLVRAGAFDSVDQHRARLFASVGIAMAAAEQESRSASQVSLFGDDAAQVGGAAMVDAPEWDERQQLQNEKLALGFYYSGHPFRFYEKEFASFVSTRLDRFQPPSPDEGARQQLLVGVIESVRMQRAGNGRMMVMVISDGTASQEVVLYDELLERRRNLVKEDAVVLVEAKVRSFRRGGDNGDASVFVRISADNIYDLAGARERFGRVLRLGMNGAADAQKLRQLLEPYRNGGLRVCVAYTSARAQAEFDLGEDWKVRPDDALISELGSWLDPENVRVVYQ
ncbi:MAG: DNA polymerase III subunit alpha [Betaproteobacteria bacterium]|jgi:DNA polymerase-3 subunit alpha|nr:MAG: DNA polymerase III subunit alpha [Betaproteobacteria bacterium]